MDSPIVMAVLAALPWLLGGVVLAAVVRLPRPLPEARAPEDDSPAAPLVSVVIPARNEARNIETVLASVTASEGVRFEVIVVDDRSDDATALLARTVPRDRAERLLVLEGDPLPDGWLGKPWACHQGAGEARGDVLLFTDADTVHGPRLLARALAGLEEDGADTVTLVGRQILGGFWERVVQPHVFMGMLVRYPRQGGVLPAERWRDAIANGQYILLRRRTYDAVDGHAGVKGEVVEDLRLAQRLVRSGHRLSMRRAEDDLGTRMYRSLGDLVEGWTKNLVLGGRASFSPGLLRSLAPGLFVLTAATVWLAPPGVLLATWMGSGGSALELWAGLTTGVSMAFWAAVSARFGASPFYGVLYPLGVAMVIWIMLRAWIRGTRVEWKGREYRVAGVGE